MGSAQLFPHSAQHGMDGFGLEKTSRGESDQCLFVWNNYEVVWIQTVLVLFLRAQARSEGLSGPWNWAS